MARGSYSPSPSHLFPQLLHASLKCTELPACLALLLYRPPLGLALTGSAQPLLLTLVSHCPLPKPPPNPRQDSQPRRFPGEQ